MGTNTGSSGTSDGNGNRNQPPIRLWLTSGEACSHLGIGQRALRKRVAAGRVERRRVGRECRYRILTTPEPVKAEHRNQGGIVHRNTGTNNSGTGTVAFPALHAAPTPEQAPDSILVGLVEQLTADVARANSDKGEAVAIGWMLAEQREQLAAERDTLAAQLAELQQMIFRLTDSPLAWPIKRRILAALQRTLH